MTFRAPIAPGSLAQAEVEPQIVSRLESQLESWLESLDRRILHVLQQGPLGKAEIAARLGQKGAGGQLHKVIRELVGQGFIMYTIPDKPNSRLQKYRLTAVGMNTLGPVAHEVGRGA